jgi:hypothetical protein
MLRDQTLIDTRQSLPGGLHELVSTCEVESGEEERALTARKHALAAITARRHASSPAELQDALCARGSRDLTPLAQACDAGEASLVSHLLSLGAARSIFVRGFMPQELLCTLPYSHVVPERHVSKGRALAEQRRDIYQNSQAFETSGEIEAALDAALADYITQFAAGALEFAEGNGSLASDDASSAGTVGASATPRDARSPGTNSESAIHSDFIW